MQEPLCTPTYADHCHHACLADVWTLKGTTRVISGAPSASAKAAGERGEAGAARSCSSGLAASWNRFPLDSTHALTGSAACVAVGSRSGVQPMGSKGEGGLESRHGRGRAKKSDETTNQVTTGVYGSEDAADFAFH